MRLGNEVERMFDAGEIRLRGKREEVGAAAIDVRQARSAEQRRSMRSSGAVERRMIHTRATRPRELAHAVHRIVVVEREERAAASGKRVHLADEFEAGRGVCREDRNVVVVGVEPVEHGAPRALDEVCPAVDDSLAE